VWLLASVRADSASGVRLTMGRAIVTNTGVSQHDNESTVVPFDRIIAFDDHPVRDVSSVCVVWLRALW
jgi:hypothetical protein